MKKILEDINSNLFNIKNNLECINKSIKNLKDPKWIIILPTILTILGMLFASYYGAKWAIDLSKDKEPYLDYWYTIELSQENKEYAFINLHIRNINNNPTDAIRVLLKFGNLNESGIYTIDEGISGKGSIERKINIHKPSWIKEWVNFNKDINTKIEKMKLQPYNEEIKLGLNLRCSECEGNTALRYNPDSFIIIRCEDRLWEKTECWWD